MGRTLVHLCCAVDAIYFLKRYLQEHPNEEVIAYFYDPNIHPPEEYALRLKESQRACEILGVKLIEGPYEPERWFERVKGLEREPEKGARCSVCFEERLLESAKKAKELGCDKFTTSLLMSPKKSREKLIKIGERIARGQNLTFEAPDYRKGGGVQRMNELVRQTGIWRQDYCGCTFALMAQKGENAFLDLVGFEGRLPATKAEHLFVRDLRLWAQRLNLPAFEDEFWTAAWFPLRGYLRIEGFGTVPSLIKPFSAPIRGVLKGRVQKRVKNKLFLNKQGAAIELIDRPPRPLGAPATATPTFQVDRRYEKLLLERKIVAQLEVKLLFAKSRNLILGDPSGAREVYLLPADTLWDGTGVDLFEVKEWIGSVGDLVASGEAAVVVLGAQSYGAGLARLKELYPDAEDAFKRAPLKDNFVLP